MGRKQWRIKSTRPSRWDQINRFKSRMNQIDRSKPIEPKLLDQTNRTKSTESDYSLETSPLDDTSVSGGAAASNEIDENEAASLLVSLRNSTSLSTVSSHAPAIPSALNTHSHVVTTPKPIDFKPISPHRAISMDQPSPRLTSVNSVVKSPLCVSASSTTTIVTATDTPSKTTHTFSASDAPPAECTASATVTHAKRNVNSTSSSTAEQTPVVEQSPFNLAFSGRNPSCYADEMLPSLPMVLPPAALMAPNHALLQKQVYNLLAAQQSLMHQQNQLYCK